MVFDIPVIISIPKIEDFNNSNLTEKFHNVKLIKS